MSCTCTYEHILLKLALIWRAESQHKDLEAWVTGTSACVIVSRDQRQPQIASECSNGKQQVHLKHKTVIIPLSTTLPCPMYFSSKTWFIYEWKTGKASYKLPSGMAFCSHNCQKSCCYAEGQSMVTAEANEDWKEPLSFLRLLLLPGVVIT